MAADTDLRRGADAFQRVSGGGAGAVALEVAGRAGQVAALAAANVLGLRRLRRAGHHRFRRHQRSIRGGTGNWRRAGTSVVWIHRHLLGHSSDAAGRFRGEATPHRLVAEAGISRAHGGIPWIHGDLWRRGALAGVKRNTITPTRQALLARQAYRRARLAILRTGLITPATMAFTRLK